MLVVFFPLFVADTNTIYGCNLVAALSETKLNHVNAKAKRVHSIVKKTNIQLPSSLMTKFQNLVYQTNIHLFLQVLLSLRLV